MSCAVVKGREATLSRDVRSLPQNAVRSLA